MLPTRVSTLIVCLCWFSIFAELWCVLLNVIQVDVRFISFSVLVLVLLLLSYSQHIHDKVKDAS